MQLNFRNLICCTISVDQTQSGAIVIKLLIKFQQNRLQISWVLSHHTISSIFQHYYAMKLQSCQSAESFWVRILCQMASSAVTIGERCCLIALHQTWHNWSGAKKEKLGKTSKPLPASSQSVLNYSFQFDSFGVHYREKDFELSKFGASKDLELRYVGQCFFPVDFDTGIANPFSLFWSFKVVNQSAITGLPFSPVGNSVTGVETWIMWL